MIISPLEQFYVLSVYDFSLTNISNFEIIYAKLLFLVWYTLSLPALVLHQIGALHASGDLPMIFGTTASLFELAAHGIYKVLPGDQDQA
jgi:hypothetical protein